MNAQAYFDIGQSIHYLGKTIKMHEMKNEKKTTYVFLLQKYGKF